MNSKQPFATLLLLMSLLIATDGNWGGRPFMPPHPVFREKTPPRHILYRVTRLGLPPSDDYSACINDRGKIVLGNIFLSDGKRQTLHADLPGFKGALPKASGINNRGDIIANFTRQDSGAYIMEFGQAVVYHGNTMRRLRPFAHRFSQSLAYGINNKSDVVGNAFNISVEIDNAPVEAFLMISRGKTLDLGPGEALCVNDKDQAVLHIAGEKSFLWDSSKGRSKHFMPTTCLLWHGQRTFLESPHGYGDITTVTGINNNSQVVGWVEKQEPGSYDGAPPNRAFLWQHSHMSVFGTLGGPSSEAHGVNNIGWVVGQADTSFLNPDGAAKTHAVLWRRGRMRDLNSLIPAHTGWVLYSADGINDRGQIVGRGNKGVFLLDPQ